MEYATLNNGVKMPMVGFGVYQIPPEDTERCVREAIEVGYRSIDTAWAYFNENAVGAAINGCGVPREELFVTSKIWYLTADMSVQRRRLIVHCGNSRQITLI